MRRLIVLAPVLAFISACSSRPAPPLKAAFYVFRLEPSALVQLSTNHQILHEIPISVPEGCALDNMFGSPRGPDVAIEFSCSFGQAVVGLDTDTGELKQLVTDSDSHFLAWQPDGQALYLKVDSINRPHIVRVALDGSRLDVPITELTYDLSPLPSSYTDFLFSFSRGMGLGSEMWSAQAGGQVVKQVAADPHSYLSFARWSPDHSQIAFIKIPDSATPFTVGQLWVMAVDGSGARKLADADAGHGYAAAWSPDGTRIAYVVRDNPNDARADQDANALQSNLAIVNVRDGTQSRLTKFQNARVEAPVWSPDGNLIAFTAVLNDKMNVYTVDVATGEVGQVMAAPGCCPVWIWK